MNPRHLEDVLEAIDWDIQYEGELKRVLPEPFFQKFVPNVASWSRRNKPLTTEQVRIGIEVVRKTRTYLIEKKSMSPDDIDTLLVRPRYRLTPTLSAQIPREVRYLGHGLLGFRFKRNDNIIEDIKRLQKTAPLIKDDIVFDPETRLWIIPLTRDTIEPVITIIGAHRFGVSEDVELALLAASNEAGEPTRCRFQGDTISIEVNDNEFLAKFVLGALGGVRQ